MRVLLLVSGPSGELGAFWNSVSAAGLWPSRFAQQQVLPLDPGQPQMEWLVLAANRIIQLWANTTVQLKYVADGELYDGCDLLNELVEAWPDLTFRAFLSDRSSPDRVHTFDSSSREAHQALEIDGRLPLGIVLDNNEEPQGFLVPSPAGRRYFYRPAPALSRASVIAEAMPVALQAAEMGMWVLTANGGTLAHNELSIGGGIERGSDETIAEAFLESASD